ncbi:hypothetical protein C8R43DRAFT_1119732 [Mycena crocata]|nr:hypothetical protein C8R43DRAFT_1119732 [Mycena crocata]
MAAEVVQLAPHIHHHTFVQKTSSRCSPPPRRSLALETSRTSLDSEMVSTTYIFMKNPYKTSSMLPVFTLPSDARNVAKDARLGANIPITPFQKTDLQDTLLMPIPLTPPDSACNIANDGQVGAAILPSHFFGKDLQNSMWTPTPPTLRSHTRTVANDARLGVPNPTTCFQMDLLSTTLPPTLRFRTRAITNDARLGVPNPTTCFQMDLLSTTLPPTLRFRTRTVANDA